MHIRRLIPLTALSIMFTGLCPPVAAAGEPTQPAGVIVVATRGNNTVTILDAATGQAAATIDAGVGAHELAVSPDGSIAVGSAYGSGPGHKTPDNRLIVVDLKTRALVRTIDLGEHQRPNDLVILADNRHALCTSEVKKALLKIDLVGGTIVKTIALEHPAAHMLTALPDSDRAYVAHVMPGGVSVVNLKNGTVEAFIETAIGAEGIAVSPDGSRLWVANNRAMSISIIDTTTNEVIKTIASEGFPFRVRFTPDGQKVVISHPMSGQLKVFNAADNELIGAADIKEGGHSLGPTSIAISGCGRYAFAACEKAGRIITVDLDTLKSIGDHRVGPGPDGLAWAPGHAAPLNQRPS